MDHCVHTGFYCQLLFIDSTDSPSQLTHASATLTCIFILLFFLSYSRCPQHSQTTPTFPEAELWLWQPHQPGLFSRLTLPKVTTFACSLGRSFIFLFSTRVLAGLVSEVRGPSCSLCTANQFSACPPRCFLAAAVSLISRT